MNKGFEGVDCYPYAEQIAKRKGLPVWSVLAKGIRLREGLSLEEMAEVLGCGHMTVWKIENGRGGRGEVIKTMEEIYGVKLVSK